MLFPPLNAETEREAIGLLQEIVRLNTANPPGDEAAVSAYLTQRLQAEAILAAPIELSPGRSNLLARWPGTGERPALILSGHIDTVPPGQTPWVHDPWQAEIQGRRLYGRGASDMKSGLAAMTMAMILLKRAGCQLRGDLVLAGSAGEEVDCLGARAFVQGGLLDGAGGLVVGEPTGNRVLIAHKGALWLRLTTRGRTAHGSMPEQGENAIWHMYEALGRLRDLMLPVGDHPLLGHATVSVNVIHGGNKTNVVPDFCTVDVDIRTVPGQVHAEVLAMVKRALAGIDCTIEVIADRSSVGTPRTCPLVETALSAARQVLGQVSEPGGVAYFTDASVYQPASGLPVVIFGPGEAEVAHQPDEWVDLPAYLEAIRVYMVLAYERLAVTA